MKRNILRRSLSLILTLLVALGMTCTVFASEQEKDGAMLSVTDKAYVGEIVEVFMFDSYDGADPVINGVVSSDPSICQFSKESANTWIGKGLKPGTVTVTVNYTHKGASGTMSSALTIMPVPKVFKSLKVNGKKVDVSKHAFGINKKAKKAKSVKIKAKPASGWQVKKVYVYGFKSAKQAKGYKLKGTKAQVKKGKKISFPKKYKYLLVTMKMVNKTTHETVYYQVQFYRNKAIVS